MALVNKTIFKVLILIKKSKYMCSQSVCFNNNLYHYKYWITFYIILNYKWYVFCYLMIKKSLILNDKGKNILITGASSGIGFYALVDLLKKENYLFVPVRSFSRAQDLKFKLSNYFNDEYLNKFLNLIYDTDFSDLNNIYKIREFIIEKKKENRCFNS